MKNLYQFYGSGTRSIVFFHRNSDLRIKFLGLLGILVCLACKPASNGQEKLAVKDEPSATTEDMRDTMLLESDTHYIDGFPTLAPSGMVNAIIEIPSGTVAKWEVDKSSGHLRWALTDNKPRNVKYLGYPANYGMIPRTLLAVEDGGDGDPLDVIILGPAIERGRVVECRLIGVIELLDKGEQDDKLIAVTSNTAFENVHTIAELRERFPGVTDILETWFTHYKDPGFIEIKGISEVDRAAAILEQAMKGYAARK